MNGEILLERTPIFLRSVIPFGPDARNYEHFPVLSTIEEITEKYLSSTNEIYNVQTLTLNEFLIKRFGYGIPEFMQLYSKLHFSAVFKKEVEGFALPVPEKTICYFGESDNPSELSCKLANYQSTIDIDDTGKTFLNLHDNSIYKFTLIRAKFNLNTEQDKFFFGYFHETDKFRIFIKSSAQFDLTLVYEEL